MKNVSERNIKICNYLKNQNEDNKTDVFIFVFVYKTYFTYLHSAKLKW